MSTLKVKFWLFYLQALLTDGLEPIKHNDQEASIENNEIMNKNYYLVRNAGCTRSRSTLKLSLTFLIN